MDDVLFVINPLAASGRADRVWERLAGRSRALRDAAVIRTADPFAATRQMIERLKPSIRRVVAIGGDGTIHHTANVLLSLPAHENRSFGVVPAGSGSDLARGLQLAREPARALAEALEGRLVDVDVLRLAHGAAERYVVNVASLGVSVPVVNRLSGQARRGRLAYLSGALGAIVSQPPTRARIVVDGRTWFEGGLLLLAVANGVRFGRGMRIAPGARADDGLMDIVVVEDVPRWRLLSWLPALYGGRHYAAPFVHHVQARHVDVESLDGDGRFEADGEISLPLPASVSVLPGALRFRAGFGEGRFRPRRQPAP